MPPRCGRSGPPSRAATIFGICVAVAWHARVADQPNVRSTAAPEDPGAMAAGGEWQRYYEGWHGNTFVLRPGR
jgi:hypothetical protein